MTLAKVIHINRSGHFSIDEANELLPVVKRITAKYSKSVDSLINRLEGLGPERKELTTVIEADVNEQIKSWQAKIERLGGTPRGLWLVDFDSGNGYYSWKFPENSIKFWHAYDSGYSKRVPIPDEDRVSSDVNTSALV